MKIFVTGFLLMVVMLADAVSSNVVNDRTNQTSILSPTMAQIATNKSFSIDLDGIVDEENSNVAFEIQEMLRRDSTLSWSAKNIRVVVVNDEVLLDGVVQNKIEHSSVLKKAREIAPSYKLVNSLRLEKKKSLR